MKWKKMKQWRRADAPKPEGEPDRQTQAGARVSPETDQLIQINIRASRETIERFRQMCRDERRTYGAMLEILIERFDGDP